MAAPSKHHLLEDLAEEITALRESAHWQHYLACQARFHRYSPRNVLLISMQRPDATQVAGFSTWKSLGRNIKRGEKAIAILAPVIRKGSHDDEQEPRIGFRWVHVFDVTQTEGEALPSPVALLEGQDPSCLEAQLSDLAVTLGFRVAYEELATGVNGELRWATSLIVVAPHNPPLQRIKTIVHELGHALLHQHQGDRRRAEMEAESVAFVVLKALTIDSRPYSTGYVASWLGDHDDVSAALLSCCANVHAASSTILEGLLHIQANHDAA